MIVAANPKSHKKKKKEGRREEIQDIELVTMSKAGSFCS